MKHATTSMVRAHPAGKQHFFLLAREALGYARWLVSTTNYVFSVYFNDLAHYLSIDCFLKASAHMSVLTIVQSDMAMTISIGV